MLLCRQQQGRGAFHCFDKHTVFFQLKCKRERDFKKVSQEDNLALLFINSNATHRLVLPFAYRSFNDEELRADLKMSKNLDPKQLEIKTLSVENTLTPLVMQVFGRFFFLISISISVKLIFSQSINYALFPTKQKR